MQPRIQYAKSVDGVKKLVLALFIPLVFAILLAAACGDDDAAVPTPITTVEVAAPDTPVPQSTATAIPPEPVQQPPEPTQPAPATSGIEGQVLLGPLCPVVREGMPCPDRPFQATIVVWNAERTEKVQTFTTDGGGRFRVPIAPGDYYIDPQPAEPDSPFPAPMPQTVTVPPGQFIQITVQYDTGIR